MQTQFRHLQVKEEKKNSNSFKSPNADLNQQKQSHMKIKDSPRTENRMESTCCIQIQEESERFSFRQLKETNKKEKQ